MGFTNINTENFEVYLTPMAREKLYTGKGGKIDIKYFSLHDGDINYTKSAKTQSFVTTPAGKYTKVPDLRGEPSTIGINGCQVYQLDDFILRKDVLIDEKCPAGYYKDENGVCVEMVYGTKSNKEKIIRRRNKNNSMSSRKFTGSTPYSMSKKTSNTRRGTPPTRIIPGGSSY